MNILLVDGAVLFDPLREAGHKVLRFSRPEAGIAALHGILKGSGFRPDLILQAEHLGRRLLLSGLPEADCPKLFWAVDSHLNLWWHRYYARLFDAVLTPHLSLWLDLPPEWRHPRVHRFSKPGCARPFRPHSGRSRLLSLVGVLNGHRPMRLWLAQLLKERWGVEARQGMSFAEMLDLYSDTRIIPNESIAREVNFRLMEAASCGAALLTQDVGQDQNELFAPGREMLVYRDAAELVARIEALEADPTLAESIGRAAWERVQREHLPEHRVARIEEIVRELGAESRSAGNDAAEHMPDEDAPAPRAAAEPGLLWLCAAQIHRSWTPGEYPAALLAKARDLPLTPEVLTCRLRLMAEYDGIPDARPHLERILAQNQYRGDLDLNLTGSLIAARNNDFPLALQFWLRQILYGRAGQKPGPGCAAASPENLYSLCLAWADLLARAGRKAQIGFTVNIAVGIPACAWTTLLLAQNFAPGPDRADDLPRLAKIEALTANIKGLEFYHLGYSAQLCLARPDDWRPQMRYAEACLQTFRLEEGLAERVQAEAKRKQCREEKDLPATCGATPL